MILNYSQSRENQLNFYIPNKKAQIYLEKEGAISCKVKIRLKKLIFLTKCQKSPLIKILVQMKEEKIKRIFTKMMVQAP